MRKAIAPVVLAIVLAVPALVPTVEAHAAPEPLENAKHVLADEPEDAFYWYDGYDLYNLFTREAYIEPLDETGIVFRSTLYGGFAPEGTAEELAIDVQATSPEGTQTLTITTTDDETWEGDLEVLVANVTEDDPPWTGVTARMQVFASYEQLGVAPGGSLEEIQMVSRADDDVRDIAPGGFFLPHSQGQAEVPAESERLVDPLELSGPTGYIDIETSTDATNLTVTVENTLDNGQHVKAKLTPTDGWNATVNGSAQASLPGGETTTFQIEAQPDPEATDPLPLAIVTDLGGREVVHVGVNGTELQTDLEPNAVDVEPATPEPNESPTLAAIASIALLAGLAWMTRCRRQR